MKTAIDTNVLVRFLVRDDERQAKLVLKRLKTAEEQRERFFISTLVILETLWVLESAYERSRADILHAFQELKHMSVFDLENPGLIERLIRDGISSAADLSDLLIAHNAELQGCDQGLTFDKQAVRQIPFFELLK